MPHTFYDILEISPSASQETIAEAYKDLHSRLAARINGIEGTDQDTLDRITALREAFTTLSDPERRRDYDRQLASGQKEAPTAIGRAPRPFLKSLSLMAVLGLFAVGYILLLSELQTVRREGERIKAEALMVDLQLQREREEQRLAAQADFQRRRDEAIERFIREQSGNGQRLESRPPDKIRS